MTWIKLDDGFGDHPKIVRAGPLGLAAQVKALCYAARHGTDGFIPDGVVDSFLSGFDSRKEMVAAGLWEIADGGFIIHDFLEYNPSKADVAIERLRRFELSRAGGLARAAATSRTAGRFASRTAGGSLVGVHQPEDQRPTSPVPVPVPIPNSLLISEKLESTALRATTKKAPTAKREPREHFEPPSIEEVEAHVERQIRAGRTHYAKVNPTRFVAYYVSNGWMVGRNPMKNWRAAVVTWANKENS